MKTRRRSGWIALAIATVLAAAGVGGVQASPAEAALDPDNVTWFDSSRVGIFSHYVAGLTPYSDGTAPLTSDDLADDFDAEQYAADVDAFGAEYVIFTAWHYLATTLYPSSVMDSWRPGHSTDRDVIADLIDALEPYGIKLVLYVHPVEGDDWPISEQTATGWNDPTNNFATYNNFINDLLEEVGLRYGTDVAGYWVDMTFYGPSFGRISDTARFKASLLEGNPNRVLLGNGGYDNPITNLSPAVDLPSREYYPPSANVADWRPSVDQTVLQATTEWWAQVPQSPATTTARYSAADMFRYTVLQAGTAHRGGIAWNVPPFAGSQLWDAGVQTMIDDFGSLVTAAGPSLRDTRASAAFPTSNDTFGALADGIVATASADGSKTYIHVLNPPTGSTLTMRAPVDGRQFSGAQMLANGHAVTVSQTQTSMTLTLGSGDSWDAIDTVIELSNPAPPISKVNDSDASVSYFGSWGVSSGRSANDYQDDVHYTSDNGAYFEYTFNGVGVKYLTPAWSGYGDIDIYLDGIYQTTVSSGSSSYQAQQVVYSVQNLSPGTHVLKGVKASGSWIHADAFIATPAPTVLNDDDPRIRFVGPGWGTASYPGRGDINDDFHYSGHIGDYVNLVFYGTGIDVIGSRQPETGSLTVQIDGGTPVSVNTNDPVPQMQQDVFSASGLTADFHTVKVTFSGGSMALIDGFRVHY